MTVTDRDGEEDSREEGMGQSLAITLSTVWRINLILFFLRVFLTMNDVYVINAGTDVLFTRFLDGNQNIWFNALFVNNS